MKKEGGVWKLGEQPRRADVAMLLFQASALLPGYSLSHTCPESLELQVSSGFFFFLRENFILVDRAMLKKKEKKGGCPWGIYVKLRDLVYAIRDEGGVCA